MKLKKNIFQRICFNYKPKTIFTLGKTNNIFDNFYESKNFTS